MANEGANPWCLICKSSLESTLKESAMRPKCRIFGKLGMKLPITPAGSTGRCNTGLQFTRWSFKAQGLSRALIEAQSYLVKIGLRVAGQVSFLREVLS